MEKMKTVKIIDKHIVECIFCGSSDIDSKVINIDCGNVSELEFKCKNCNMGLGSWAYG